MYPVVRNRGFFGAVSVLWIIQPALSGDVSPLQGNITFKEREVLKNLTVFSEDDEVNIELNSDFLFFYFPVNVSIFFIL